MKVEFHAIGHDPVSVTRRGEPYVEQIMIDVDADRDAPFYDGPASRRLVTLDYDSEMNPIPGVTKIVQDSGNKIIYHWFHRDGIESPGFLRTNCFGLVLMALQMFEEPCSLGRMINLNTNNKQLKILPRAGVWDNACYSRGTGSLQFYYYPNPSYPDETVYTALSRDIVVHEAGHAILDGIAPYLYDSLTPESRGVHESIADFTALWMALKSSLFSRTIIERYGSVDKPSEINAIAEDLARKRRHDRLPKIRSLLNEVKLEELPNRSMASYTYSLSSVLSGALYKVFSMIFNYELKKIYEENGVRNTKTEVTSLSLATDRIRGLMMRGLDYLPPSEATFADYGRAMIAADLVMFPERNTEREWIKNEFHNRGIIQNMNQLDSDFDTGWHGTYDIDELVKNEKIAADFIDKNRDLLKLPENTPFIISDRTKALKQVGDHHVNECLLKVIWKHEEDNLSTIKWSRRTIVVGSTIAIDFNHHKINSLLTSNPIQHPEEWQHQKSERDKMLTWLINTGQSTKHFLNNKLKSTLNISTQNEVLHIQGIGDHLQLTSKIPLEKKREA